MISMPVTGGNAGNRLPRTVCGVPSRPPDALDSRSGQNIRSLSPNATGTPWLWAFTTPYPARASSCRRAPPHRRQRLAPESTPSLTLHVSCAKTAGNTQLSPWATHRTEDHVSRCTAPRQHAMDRREVHPSPVPVVHLALAVAPGRCALLLPEPLSMPCARSHRAAGPWIALRRSTSRMLPVLLLG